MIRHAIYTHRALRQASSRCKSILKYNACRHLWDETCFTLPSNNNNKWNDKLSTQFLDTWENSTWIQKSGTPSIQWQPRSLLPKSAMKYNMAIMRQKYVHVINKFTSENSLWGGFYSPSEAWAVHSFLPLKERADQRSGPGGCWRACMDVLRSPGTATGGIWRSTK